MLEHPIEFRDHGETVEVWAERDCGPFDDFVLGTIMLDHEDCYRFHPAAGVSMTCKQCRVVSEKLSVMNTAIA